MRVVVCKIIILFSLLSNTALINVGSTGIPLFYLSFTLIPFIISNDWRLNKKVLIFLLLNFTSLVLPVFYHFFCDSILNFSNVTQFISRLLLVLNFLIIYRIFSFLNDNEKNRIFKFLLGVLTIIWIYGIYEFFAKIYDFPLYLSDISNSASFYIVDNTGGWTETFRVRGVWAEPSFSSIPILIYLYLLESISLKRNKFFLLLILVIVYSFFTFSRVAWSLIILYLTLKTIFGRIWKRNINFTIDNKRDSIYEFLITITLFVFVLISSLWVFFTNDIFNDSSSSGRSGSAIIGFNIWFDNLFFGTGFNTFIQHRQDYISKVGFINERFCHSVVPNYLYQMGIFGFLYLFSFVFLLLQGLKNNIMNFAFFLLLFLIANLSGDVIYQSTSWLFMLLFLWGNEKNNLEL